MMGALAGLLIGFVFTNTINRRDHDEMRAELERLRAATSTRAGEENVGGNSGDDPAVPRVSDEQLRGAIARADSTPNDLDIQRNLGATSTFTLPTRTTLTFSPKPCASCSAHTKAIRKITRRRSTSPTRFSPWREQPTRIVLKTHVSFTSKPFA